jgi:glycosyltransferase involved in cell wall biosynthesis
LHLITFVVPVRNDEAGLRRCLRSIMRDGGGVDLRLVVADNGSSDGSAAAARALHATVLELPGVRVGELRNRGAEAAAGDVLAFVDADHEISTGWIAAALETLEHPDVAAVGAPYSAPDPATWVQRLYDAFRTHARGIQDVEWLGAGNLVVRADVFRRVGGFDGALEACEDVDFCQRLRKGGFRIVSDARLRSVHYGDPASLGALFRSELWRGRNNLYVTLRGPLSLRNLVSVVIPAIDLACVGLALAGAIAGSWRMPAAAAALFLGLAALRAGALYRRLTDRRPLDALRALLVACTYDLARALALVGRASHRRARGQDVVASELR